MLAGGLNNRLMLGDYRSDDSKSAFDCGKIAALAQPLDSRSPMGHFFFVAQPRQNPASRTLIRFPVLRGLSITGYELFPGVNRKGIQHDFGNEVTVVVGVNGLGKTTLLNIILRLLVGPRDPKKANSFEPDVASRELIKWRDRGYFSSRVGDEASDAKADAIFEFGPHKLFVSRSLQNLELFALTLDGEELPLDEDRFGETAASLCGVGDRYDFDFLVRNLVFFLERRVPLFWNENGQFEIFRILFFDAKLAADLGSLASEIKSDDSHFRNMRWSFNRREEAYAAAKAAESSGQISQDHAELAAVEGAIKGAEEARSAASDDLLARLNERKTTISNLEQKRLDLEGLIRSLQSQRQQFFARSFPTMPKTAEYILGQLAAGGG